MSVDVASHVQLSAYPFSAVVAGDEAKLALMLLAVDRRLRGAIILGASGTAKSLLARSYARLAMTHLIQAPLGTTEDRLIGGVDIERTIAAGARRASAGLIAQAHRGALLVDDVNLLDEQLCGLLACALEDGVVRVEREGISAAFPSDFVLIATSNPSEREVGQVLKDRVGLMVEIDSATGVDDRAEIIARTSRFDRDPAGFNQEFEAEELRIQEKILDARTRLPAVAKSEGVIRSLVAAARRLGVEGNRADILAVRAACASAALNGRNEVIEEDVITAIRLVLAPRATRLPEAQQDRATENAEEETFDDEESEGESIGARAEDLIVRAMDAQVPADATKLSQLRNRHFIPGKSAQARGATGGRYVASSGRRHQGSRVAIDATLRAAAPHQKSRRGNDRKVRIAAEDLRYKKFRRKSGVLFLFAVDASSSMLANRFGHAKGAILRLLRQAYLHRDRVAVVSFRGKEAEVLLGPTRSVEMGRRLIDALPAGGGTPLAKGLVSAIEVALQARARDRARSLLLVMTDGRANVGLRGDRDRAVIDRELRDVGATLAREGIETVVIDTRSKFTSSGEARALAEILRGRYAYLPRIDEAWVYDVVSAAAEELRRE
jgi:magnesium chelatase subunit D